VWRKRWMQWLTLWLGLGVVGGSVSVLLSAQGLTYAGFVLRHLTIGVCYLWLVGGIFALAQQRYVLWSVIHLAAGVVVGLLAMTFVLIHESSVMLFLLCAGVGIRSVVVVRAFTDRPSWRPMMVMLLGAFDIMVISEVALLIESDSLAIGLRGMYLMLASFLGGLWLIRLLLSLGSPVLGVARTLIDEAVRMKVALVFIVLILVIMPALPFANESNEALRYRIGTFLHWSLWSTSLLLGLMTVFLACGTICGEVRDRQIYLTMTKPVSRGQYLLGKWLGIALLNLLLICVSGAGIYTFARLMQGFEAINEYDKAMVYEQVLTARTSVIPQMPEGQSAEGLVNKQLQHVMQEQRYGESLLNNEQARKEAFNLVIERWHTVPKGGSQTYVFTDLGSVRLREDVQTVQLLIKPSAMDLPDNGQITLKMKINGRPFAIPQTILHELVQVIEIPLWWINEHGWLEVQIDNEHISDVSFSPDKGMQLLYKTGSFESNLLRAVMMIWLQQCFLAMVGLMAGTLVTFPVACLFSMMIFLTAITSGFLTESLSEYAVHVDENATTWQTITQYTTTMWRHLGTGEYWKAVKVPIQVMAEAAVVLVPSFAKYNPAPLVAEGKLVTDKLMGEAVLFVGLVWTGLTGLIGYLIFRKRELARVTL